MQSSQGSWRLASLTLLGAPSYGSFCQPNDGLQLAFGPSPDSAFPQIYTTADAPQEFLLLYFIAPPHVNESCFAILKPLLTILVGYRR